jgi:hypothetical protein
MEDFKAPLGTDRIRVIFQSILGATLSLDVPDSSAKTSAPDDDIDFGGKVENILNTLIENSNSTSISIIISVIFDEVERKELNSEKLLNILIQSVPAQFICVVVSETFRKLDSSNDPTTIMTLTNSLASLVISNRSPLGYSAVELADLRVVQMAELMAAVLVG